MLILESQGVLFVVDCRLAGDKTRGVGTFGYSVGMPHYVTGQRASSCPSLLAHSDCQGSASILLPRLSVSLDARLRKAAQGCAGHYPLSSFLLSPKQPTWSLSRSRGFPTICEAPVNAQLPFVPDLLIIIPPVGANFSGMELLETIRDGDFFGSNDEASLQIIAKHFATELEMLKCAEPSVEADRVGNHKHCLRSNTFDSDHLSVNPSLLLFGADYPEVNRTLLSVLSLKWLLNHDIEKLTTGQKPGTRLTKSTFGDLRDALLIEDGVDFSSSEDLCDLVILSICSDCGKDRSISRRLEEAFIKIDNDVHNHDELVHVAASHGLLPCLRDLPKHRRDDILLALKSAAKLNLAQLAQGECVPASLTSVSALRGSTRAFHLKYAQAVLDVAGALANMNPHGALAMTEPVAATFLSLRRPLFKLFNHELSARECYDHILNLRGELLERVGFPPLSVALPHDRALLRLLAMGRADSKKTASAFSVAFDGLEASQRQALISLLNADGLNGGLAVIPYYMPGLIASGLGVVDPSAEEAKVIILRSLFSFLLRVMQDARDLTDQQGGVVERSVAFAKQVVSSEAFRSTPEVLDEIDIIKSSSS